MTHDNVCTPLANKPHNGFPIFEGRHNLAIVNVKHFGFDAEDLCAALDLGGAALGQGATGHTPVTYIPIRTGDKLDVMPLGCPHGRYAPGTKLVVVRMCAEADDPHLSIGGIRGGRRLRHGSAQCPSQKQ
jgi:hypothetical protein